MQSHNHRDLLQTSLSSFDNQHVLHPYSHLGDQLVALPEVVFATGPTLTLKSGVTVLDGISSWWACIHGYRRKELDEAVIAQLQHRMGHVMFGGLTHRPACELVARLLDLVPQGREEDGSRLRKVFLCDSGSIAVEVGMKIALQYWAARGLPSRAQFLTTRSGYHGDTFLPMSVSDPINGMHRVFAQALPQQVFVDSLTTSSEAEVLAQFEREMVAHRATLAGVIIEPIFQAAGAMHVYSPHFLASLRALTHKYELPLLLDEIATGFGRTGRMFACEHGPSQGVLPDIMMVGKALTGGLVSMGAVLVSARLARELGETPLMHGPTFMANPVACAAAIASIDLLLASPWEDRVRAIEAILSQELAPCTQLPGVKSVRVLGAIGVVEFLRPLTLEEKTEITRVVMQDHGVWLRPFASFLYTMPPFNAPLEEAQVRQIGRAMRAGAAVVVVTGDRKSPTKRENLEQAKDPITFV